MTRRRLLGLALGSLSVGCTHASRSRGTPLEPVRPGRPQARPITLRWQAPTDPRVTAFRLYTGRASGVYTFSVDLGNVTSTTCAVAGKGAWFFAVTALTESWESGFSPEARYSV